MSVKDPNKAMIFMDDIVERMRIIMDKSKIADIF